MLSKMAQPNNVGGGSGSAAGGRRVPLSLSSGSGVAGGTTISRLQQASGNGNGRSSSPQNSNSSKKGEHLSGPFIAMKKTNLNQQRSASASSSPSSKLVSKHDDEKKSQNGVNKSTNGNQKASSHNSGSSAAAVAKDQPKQPKEKEQKQEKKEAPKPEVKDEEKTSKKESETETKQTPASVEIKETKVTEVIDVDEEPKVDVVPTTPTSERKSSRRIAVSTTPTSTTSTVNATPPAVTPQKTPTKVETVEPKSESPAQKQQPIATEPSVEVAAVEDVEMETLMVDASPIRSAVQQSAQPAATSTPGRNLFGYRSSSKQVNEVELAAQLSNSPASAPARTFAQISGRRSIRPTTGLTPGKMGSYRCVNTSELDTSGLTNTSMNATVGSEIPNSSSFSFSFFGRGRKRERTPPVLTGSQSANDLAQDVEMSPPKRARFEFFSMNLASPFSLLRSRFSKATISSPSARQRLDLTPPNGDDEEGSEVQNVSGIVSQEEEEEQLNKSSASKEVTVGQEAGLETPKKVSTPEKDVPEEEDKNEKAEAGKDKGDVSADLPTTEVAEAVEENSSTYGEGSNRSRCAIM